MEHHVLHVASGDRLPVIVELAAAPGRTLVFTRTKHGAKKLTKQLIASGVPAVELHGNLAQNARTRNLAAFSDGTANTLVATDIAARGIHVDDVTLVVHADPPIEHKAYLHRSGRTARAGAAGTVVTMMTDDQVADVRDLTRKAGISARTTRLAPGDPLLAELAPGDRVFSFPEPGSAASVLPSDSEGRQRRAGRSGGRNKPGHQGRQGSSAGSAKTSAKNSAQVSASGRASSGSSKGSAKAGSGRAGGRGKPAGGSVLRASSSSGGAAGFSARSGGKRRSA
jgi:superfamily II DNA/RNA helicase